ncbi:transcriptional regulator, AsnC family [Catenulispora acidiphila DSM 44928]|uniref:Transcriptional regulator, AsnC family n=1 Tax=Catenulispora acidiphila (strain DSM 44928 / JCM 14897 / NBRC 102108 / NRRL B-24433 / ID139908) TaxID=479433 RepID=C7QGU5_CATAD|nr:Lrp/AsnC family transcriptional regulator [Catenulispora acidiphila]ACU76795.1 transcriptional regulator, AsnC family [Catenulispora acidiphila DSM 44928]
MDSLDRAIIDVLRRDARASFADVGAEVGLSASAVKRRVDRLRADGAIRGFSVIVDQTALGWTTEAFVEVYCGDRTSPDVIRECVSRHPEVVAAYTITGDADALLHLVAENMRHLEEALERIRREPEIQRTRSALVLTRLLARDPLL